MRLGRRGVVCAALLAALALGFWAGHAAAQRRGTRKIVSAFGVGGLMTEDGALWQYLPDVKRWMTIDEAFRRDGREGTQILPLPVDAKAIRFMQSWGFLVTQGGDVWQYDLDSNRWVNIGAP